MTPVSLPGSLFDTYACYKKGTIAFIRWLSAQDENATERAYVNSVEELKYLANTVISKRIKIPAILLTGLRETIRARTRVSKFFKTLAKPGDQEMSSSHEHFTATLLNIYHDFHALTQPSRTSAASAPARPAKPSSKRPSNVFECLPADECNDGEDDFSVPEKSQSPSGSVPKCSQGKESKGSENDDIGAFMALAMYLSQLDHLMLLVKETWEKVACGLIPTVVAASTTSLAYQAARALEKDLEEYQIYNPDQFLTKYTTCLHSLNLSGSSFDAAGVPPELAPFREQQGPQQGWLALIEFKSFWESATAFTELQMMDSCECCQASRPCSFPSDDPMDFLAKASNCTNQEDDQIDLDRRCLRLTLRRMGQLLTMKYADPNTPIPFQTPLLQELACFLRSDADMSSPGALHAMSLSFGLEMFVQGMRSYFQASAGNTIKASAELNAHTVAAAKRPKNCRVQSLKFAIGVQGSITHLMATPNAPCGCLRIGSVGVARLLITSQVLLHQFIDTRRFDIFYQSPWISGQHMVENLVLASDFGAKAWHHAYYVGTTLHLYHTLLTLEVIKPADFAVMERLSRLFEAAVFLGQRPSRNLLSCYQRWSGGCLSFPKGRCNGMHTHDHSNGMGKKWRMKYVKDASQGGNNTNRGFNPMKISLFSLLSTRNFVLDDDVLAWVYCSKPWPKASTKDAQDARSKRDGDSFIARTVEAVQEKVLEEFRGDFPVAKMNYFAIYELCVEILKHIHEAEHPSQDPDQICSCVAGRLLGAADEYLDDLHVFKVYQERSLLERCKKGFEETLQNKSIADLLWDL